MRTKSKQNSVAERRQIVTWVPMEVHRALRIAIIEDDLRLGEVVTQMIGDWLETRDKRRAK